MLLIIYFCLVDSESKRFQKDVKNYCAQTSALPIRRSSENSEMQWIEGFFATHQQNARRAQG